VKSNERVAIVTGAASGIGLAIASRLAADGMAVSIFDRSADAVGAASERIASQGGRCLGLVVDVAEPAQVTGGIEQTVAELGAPVILVNNAGIEGFARFLDLTLDEWERLLRVNLTGTFLCCQGAVPHMVDAGWGRIVNISSSSAQGGQPLMSHYVSSKAAMIGLTKALALELGPHGITVNTIPPGFIDTPMLRASEAKGLLGPGGFDLHVDRTPVRRAGLPEDVAATASFLISEEAGYITGQVIGVNGGRNTG
jgi:2-hydroxycyclohexanecarboxyl-CoA dehydrogenase